MAGSWYAPGANGYSFTDPEDVSYWVEAILACLLLAAMVYVLIRASNGTSNGPQTPAGEDQAMLQGAAMDPGPAGEASAALPASDEMDDIVMMGREKGALRARPLPTQHEHRKAKTTW